MQSMIFVFIQQDVYPSQFFSLDLFKRQTHTCYSGGSRIYHWGGAEPLGGGTNLRHGHFLAKMCAKTKELDPVGGAHAGGTPLDPPMCKMRGNSHSWKLPPIPRNPYPAHEIATVTAAGIVAGITSVNYGCKC